MLCCFVPAGSGQFGKCRTWIGLFGVRDGEEDGCCTRIGQCFAAVAVWTVVLYCIVWGGLRVVHDLPVFVLYLCQKSCYFDVFCLGSYMEMGVFSKGTFEEMLFVKGGVWL